MSETFFRLNGYSLLGADYPNDIKRELVFYIAKNRDLYLEEMI